VAVPLLTALCAPCGPVLHLTPAAAAATCTHNSLPTWCGRLWRRWAGPSALHVLAAPA
jgi:hypothetical protein